jgi:hypothetical protein
MKHPPMTPEECFASVIEELQSLPDVTPPSGGNGFGASGLRIRNKIFAMLVRGQLVVKLPKPRVDALVAEGIGEHFDPPRNGRVMKQWVTLEPASQEEWLKLSREAMEFVASQR